MNRLLTNICSENLARTQAFYTGLFDLKVNYESDWFIHLTAVGSPALELGIIDKHHALVPEALRQKASGLYLTFVVDDVHAVYKKALEQDVKIIEEPTDTFYGQKRMLIEDPDGCILDVSSLSLS